MKPYDPLFFVQLVPHPSTAITFRSDAIQKVIFSKKKKKKKGGKEKFLSSHLSHPAISIHHSGAIHTLEPNVYIDPYVKPGKIVKNTLKESNK